jgi:hypothetical protein
MLGYSDSVPEANLPEVFDLSVRLFSQTVDRRTSDLAAICHTYTKVSVSYVTPEIGV